MNDWRSRIVVAALFWVAMELHAEITASIPNTPEWMLLFHGSAASVELMLVWSLPWLIEGKLCDDMQTLSLVCIVINALGWAAYMARIPPVFFNTLMWGMAYVQWARLCMVDRHDADTLGRDLVRRPNLLGA